LANTGSQQRKRQGQKQSGQPNGTCAGAGTLAAQVVGGTLLTGYALSKVWGPAQTAWEKCHLNKVSDKIEDIVKGAKENPRSKNGAIVGGAAAAALLYAGYCYYFGGYDK
jgi:hypothetical protein